MDKQADPSAPRAPLRIGTRGSPLALKQAEMVRAALGGGEIVTVSTKGDRKQTVPLAALGGKGVWTKELEGALLTGEIDIAVHSLKDVESERPDGLCIAAVLPRGDVRDRLVGQASLSNLAAGMRIGTSSPRRAAQMQRLVPGLRIGILRGNVDTRLAKLAAGEVDATLLASAGLERLGRANVGWPIATEVMLPAPGQAAIGIECRADDTATRAALTAINDGETFAAITAERAFARALGGSCHSPVAALARRDIGGFVLHAEILSEDGADCRSGARPFAAPEAEEAGTQFAAELLSGAPASITSLFEAA